MKPARPTGKGRNGEMPTPPKRTFTPRELGTFIPGIAREAFKKRSPANVTLFLDWPKIVGTHLANRTEPRKLSLGTLTIACSGPVAMEIQHTQTALIDRINTWCGHKMVERLKLVQDTTLRPATAPRRLTTGQSAAISSVKVPDMPEGPLRDALEALGTRVAERKAAQKRR